MEGKYMNKHAKRTRKKMQRALHPYMSWNVQNFLCRSRCDEGLAPLHEIDKISKNLYLGPKSSHFQTISSKKQHVTAFSAKSYTTHIFRPCDRSYNDIFHNFPYQAWMPPHTPNNKKLMIFPTFTYFSRSLQVMKHQNFF